MQAFFYGSQIFVYTLHVFVLSASLLYDTSLRRRVIAHDFMYCIILLGFIIAELYLLRIAGQNPGVVATAKTDDLGDLSVELLDLTQDHQGHIDNESNNRLRMSADINPSVNRLSMIFEAMPIPRRRYCELCQIEQPFRTKHCNQCQACIAKYDHHCFWIGGCVGELNVRKFFAMLFVQNATYLWMSMIVN